MLKEEAVVLRMRGRTGRRGRRGSARGRMVAAVCLCEFVLITRCETLRLEIGMNRFEIEERVRYQCVDLIPRNAELELECWESVIENPTLQNRQESGK